MKHFEFVMRPGLIIAVFFGVLSACSAPKTGNDEAAARDSSGISEEKALSTTRPSKTMESSTDQLVITITAPPGDQMIVDGTAMDFVGLREVLKDNGVSNVDFRDRERPYLSTRQVLIRCDPAQTFDYVKAILQMCAAPDVAIYKIELSSLDQAGGHSKPINADLPVEISSDAVSEELAEENPNGETKEDDASVQAKVTEGMSDRFTSVKLLQIKGSKVGDGLAKQDTAIFLNGAKVSGANFDERKEVLAKQLGAIHQTNPQLMGRIESDRGVPHGRVIAIVDAYHGAHFEKISFVSLRSSSSNRKANRMWRQLKDAMNSNK